MNTYSKTWFQTQSAWLIRLLRGLTVLAALSMLVNFWQYWSRPAPVYYAQSVNLRLDRLIPAAIPAQALAHMRIDRIADYGVSDHPELYAGAPAQRAWSEITGGSPLPAVQENKSPVPIKAPPAPPPAAQVPSGTAGKRTPGKTDAPSRKKQSQAHKQ